MIVDQLENATGGLTTCRVFISDFECAIDRAAQATLTLLDKGLKKTQSKFNG